jgi:hypothetical protein
MNTCPLPNTNSTQHTLIQRGEVRLQQYFHNLGVNPGRSVFAVEQWAATPQKWVGVYRFLTHRAAKSAFEVFTAAYERAHQ